MFWGEERIHRLDVQLFRGLADCANRARADARFQFTRFFAARRFAYDGEFANGCVFVQMDIGVNSEF
jgi:hypothetical protein